MIFKGAIMINLLGLKRKYPLSMEDRIKMLYGIDGANLHWYGKSKEIPGRKMAHITFLLNECNHLDRFRKAKEILAEVRKIWPSPNE